MSRELAIVATDLRTGGRWGRGQALKNGGIRALVRALLWAADALPMPALLLLGRVTGRVARFSRRLEDVALTNATRALGKKKAISTVAASFLSAGETVAQTLLLRRPGIRPSSHVELDGDNRERLARALSGGGGALVLSAHYGPFEHIAAVVAESGIVPAVLVRESYDPQLDPIVDAHRQRQGIEVVHRGQSPLGVLAALRRGRPVGLLVDLAGRLATEDVRFLGASAVPFPRGPATLAARLRVPVLLALLHPRPKGGFRLVFEPVECPAGQLTQRVASLIDAHVRAHPNHWLWMARPLAEK